MWRSADPFGVCVCWYVRELDSCFVPQAVLALRGSNGVGLREWLLILCGSIDGTRPSPNTLYMQSKSMSRSSRAGETLGVFKYTDFYNRKTTFSSQIATLPALGTKRPGILESWNPGILESWNLGISGIVESWNLGILESWNP